MLKPNSSTRSLRKRICELKKAAVRIDAKMGKMEKLIVSMSNSIDEEEVARRSKDRGLQS
jgi:hypothetical protein